MTKYLISSFLLLSLTMLRADDLPKRESFARYEPMLKNSPFAVATAVTVASTPDFAKDLYVANAAHTDNGDFITIASTTDHNFKEYLTTQVTVDGYSVPNVQWSDRVGETKVTITKDGQIATLGFNEALLSEALPNESPEISEPVAGVPNQTPTRFPMQIARPMSIPTIPTPPPHVRGVIRRNNQQRQRSSMPQRPLSEQENS